MSDGAREHAFTLFKSDKPGGSGLGLMVARTMIEEVHDGAITFESKRGEGTCMTVVVPARRAGAKGASEGKGREKGKGTKGWAGGGGERRTWGGGTRWSSSRMIRRKRGSSWPRF